LLVALYITFEAPLSGMSMNPALYVCLRASKRNSDGTMIYFTAPLFGVFAAAALHRRLVSAPEAGCAKMHHSPRHRCIFCSHPGQVKASVAPAPDRRVSVRLCRPWRPIERMPLRLTARQKKKQQIKRD
jgi:hypothetical protein